MSVDSHGRILVADNGTCKVYVFDSLSHPQFSFPIAEPTHINSFKSIDSSDSKDLKSQNSPLSRKPARSRISSANLVSSPITCVAVGLNDDILVGRGATIQVYDSTGTWQRQISVVGSDVVPNNGGTTPSDVSRVVTSSKALIGGLAVDAPTGVILTTVADRQRTFVQICGYKGQLSYTMDSHGAKLKRPSGICVTSSGDECVVADLGNNQIKVYKFK